MSPINQLFRGLINLVTLPVRVLLTAPQRLLGSFQGLKSVSLPARVAIFTAVFLILYAIGVAIVFGSRYDRTAYSARYTVLYVSVLVVLITVIPLVLYRTLLVYLEGDASPFPDIDLAWKKGLAELDRQGLSLSEVPLFLVLGTCSEELEQNLLEAAHQEWQIRDVPSGPSPIRWYANADGVYLVCSSSCALSRLAAEAKGVLSREKALPSASPARERPTERHGRETFVPSEEPEDYKPAGNVPPMGGRDDKGTMIGPDDEDRPGERDPSIGSERRVVQLDRTESLEAKNRLAYLCRLICRARQPLSPVNGVLALLPYQLIRRSPVDANKLGHVAQQDLGVLLKSLQLRCPVAALVVDMEEELGFRKLTARMAERHGREVIFTRRFGHGLDFKYPSTQESLREVATLACSQFDTWIYSFFSHHGALQRRSNRDLYTLVCQVRGGVRERLRNILANGFAPAPEATDPSMRHYFAGCYFAATGSSNEQGGEFPQAFVASVFRKLVESQHELEWTDEALRLEGQWQRLTRLALLFDTLLLAGLAVWIWMSYFG